MGLKQTDEFRTDAERITLTSGLTRKQVASDLGVGLAHGAGLTPGESEFSGTSRMGYRHNGTVKLASCAKPPSMLNAENDSRQPQCGHYIYVKI